MIYESFVFTVFLWKKGRFQRKLNFFKKKYTKSLEVNKKCLSLQSV